MRVAEASYARVLTDRLRRRNLLSSGSDGKENEMNAVLATIGKADGSIYDKADWQERDNFGSLEQAVSYGSFKSRQYPQTPYRVRQLRGRFALEFVPEWNLR